MQEPEEQQPETVNEVTVYDVTGDDDACDPIPSSFVDRPMNTAPWQEGERPAAKD